MKVLAAFLCATAYGQTVEGAIVNSITGAPIPGVAVEIQTGSKTSQTATTDAVGAFRVDGLPDGRYSASFHKQGFDSPPPDAEARQPFTVRAGAGAVRLQVKMTARGKVSGRVLDADGNPVPGAAIEFLRSISFYGELGTTGKDGAFSFEVSPGSYTLSARPPQGLKPPESATDEKLGWVHTWYPGVIHASAAAKIVVLPGAEIWGQDIKLMAAPVHGVRGIVRDAQGNPAAKQTVLAGPSDEIQSKDIETVSAQDGSFEFAGLHDGNWRISAESKGPEVILRGFLSVPVAGRDVEGLDLRLTPPFSVTIHTTIETPDPKMEKPFAGVLLAPAVGGGVFPQMHPASDGKLRMEPVYPGQYRVNPIRPDGPYYLASVTMGGRDIAGQYVELNAGALPIEVVYKSDGGTVRGSIENCGGAVIVLAPRDRALREQELLVTGRCTAGGHFEIRNIRPADYYAFAFEKFDWMGFEFLALLDDQSLINQAERVTVRANESSGVNLKVQ